MIRLTEDYYIDVDENNYALCWDYKRLDKKGKRVYRPLGYFGNLQELVNFWCEKVIKQHLMDSEKELSLIEAVEIIQKDLEFTREIVSKNIPGAIKL